MRHCFVMTILKFVLRNLIRIIDYILKFKMRIAVIGFISIISGFVTITYNSLVIRTYIGNLQLQHSIISTNSSSSPQWTNSHRKHGQYLQWQYNLSLESLAPQTGKVNLNVLKQFDWGSFEVGLPYSYLVFVSGPTW